MYYNYIIYYISLLLLFFSSMHCICPYLIGRARAAYKYALITASGAQTSIVAGHDSDRNLFPVLPR